MSVQCSSSQGTQKAGLGVKAGGGGGGRRQAKKSSKGPVQTMDREFGSWERHTTGFGSKMLSKMGWRQGSGLGSTGEGIVNPVRAVSHKDFGKGLAHMQVKKVPAAVVLVMAQRDVCGCGLCVV